MYIKSIVILGVTLLLSSGISFGQNKKTVDWREMGNNNGATFYEVQKDFQKDFKKYERERIREKRKGTKPGEEEEENGYEVFKRWESYMAPRVYPSGDMSLPSTTYATYMAWLKTYADNHPDAPASSGGNWTELGPVGSPSGPSPYSRTGAGRVNFVRFDPTNPNTMYIGAPNGGLWKSTDAGTTWTTNTDFLTITGCSDIVIDPTNTNIMYLATGDLESDRTSIGVLKSTDGGSTWNTTAVTFPASNNYRISKMLVNPSNPLNMLISTNGGIFRTTDGWTTKTQPLSGVIFKDMEFKPGDPNTLYAAGTTYWRSLDNGATWTDLTSSSGLPTSGVSRIALGVTTANSSYVYALIGKSSNQSFMGMYRSTDNGATFTSRSTTPNILGYLVDGSDLTAGQAFFDLSIAVSPTNAELVTTGGVNHWQSADGGSTWTNKSVWNAGVIHADVHELNYLPGSSTTLFSCNDGGIFKSTDNGTNWTDLSHNIAIAQVVKLGLSASNATAVVAGEQDNGTNLRSGSSWNNIFGGDGGECFIDYTNDNTIYIQYVQGDFQRSDNGGESTVTITSGLPGGFDFYSPWRMDPVSPNKLYVGGIPALYTSSNKGASWSALGTPPGTGTITDLAIAPSSTSTIYVVKYDAVSKSTNSGATFTDITGTLPVGSASLSSVTVSNTDANKVWVTFSGYSDGNKVFKSTDGGTSWTNVSTGLPNLPFNTIVYQNGSANDAVYAGGDVGVYYLDNTLSSWAAFNTSLPNARVTDLEIFYPTGKLRASTYGRGTWESDIKTTTVTWTGGANTAWNTAGNWNPAAIPDNTADITIPAVTNMPVFTGNFTLGSVCHNLTLQSGTTLTVTGDLTLNDGFTFNNNGLLKVGGNWTNYRTAGFNTGTGTVEFYGATASTINPYTGSPLYLINDKFDTWPGSWQGDIGAGYGQFDQNFSQNAGGGYPEAMFFQYTTTSNNTRRIYQVVNTTGLSALTLQFRHMIDQYAAGYTVKVQYSTNGTTWTDAGWSLSPSTNIAANIVTLNLTPAQGVGSATYYLAFTVTGNLNYIYGWYIDDVKLSYLNSPSEAFYNLTSGKTNALTSTTSGVVNVTNNLTVKSLAWLTNATGCTLNVTGNLIVKSDATGTGSFINNGTINGTAKVERYLTTGKWHYISTPISDGLSGIFQNDYLRTSDPTNATGWGAYITGTTDLLQVMRGYACWKPGSNSSFETFIGTLNTGTKTFTGSRYNADPSFRGWHLVGNPYPSAIDLTTGITWDQFEHAAYFWNEGESGNPLYSSGNYDVALTSPANFGTHPSYAPPTQGFFVNILATYEGSSTLTITNASRVHNGVTFLKDAPALTNGLMMTVNSGVNSYSDKITVHFNPHATASYDPGYDAYKLQGLVEAPQLYTKIGNVNVTCNSLPFDNNNMVIPMGFTCGLNGQYTLTADSLGTFADNIAISLEDLKLSTTQDLRLYPSYTFTHDTLDNANRFMLHFYNPSFGIGEQAIDKAVQIYSFGDHLYIKSLDGTLLKGIVTVYDLLGKDIFHHTLANTVLNRFTPSVNAGYYFVRVVTSEGTYNGKVFLK
jgi:hypothetical protein